MHVAHESWEIVQRVSMFDCEPTDIEAVKNQSEQGDYCACQQSVGAGAVFLEGKPDYRDDSADQNFDPEKYAVAPAGKEQSQLAFQS